MLHEVVLSSISLTKYGHNRIYGAIPRVFGLLKSYGDDSLTLFC